jgi:asparagine synthase (glutamine-hydrolysing)
MCGIFSAININNYFNKKDYENFKYATDVIAYRGPDSSDYLGINSKEGARSLDKFNVFMGHRRLSIIDLSNDGIQPMYDNNCFIIFNGEIFNYLELREELSNKGVSFKTKTDTEVILKLYQLHGSSSFHKLNGMWAFIIVDLNIKKIIVSRDRFSIKPLFYTELNGCFYFASEIKQFFKLASFTINQQNLAVFLQQGIIDQNDDTMFANIRKVKPRTNILIDLVTGNIKEEEYWQYSLTSTASNPYDEFRFLLEDSIRIRLRSDVTVGSLLSGGLDSSAISVIANKELKGSLKTYSIISNDPETSEEEFIDVLLEQEKFYNLKLKIEPYNVLKSLDKVIHHQDEPFSNFIVVAHYEILKKIKENSDIVVILSGQGGDEVLLGYLRFFFFHLKYLMKSGEIKKVTREIFYSLFNRTMLVYFQFNSAKRYIPALLKSKVNYLINRPELEPTWRFNDFRELQIQEIEKYSVPILTRYEDRNSMAHSMEIRLPFLDHRLVDFLLTTPVDLKLNQGWTKYILRKTLTEMPAKIRWRRDKKGFSIPEEHWLKNELKNEIKEYFNNSLLAKMGLVDKNKLKQIYDQYLNGSRYIHNTDISRIFITEKWLQNLYESNNISI